MVTVFFLVYCQACKAVLSLSRAVEISLQATDAVGLEQYKVMSSANDGIDICRSSITEGMSDTYRLYSTGPSMLP